MPDDDAQPHPTIALSTKVEEDFVAPLTAMRGALEILRDFPNLGEDERLRFVETALRGCARLEKGAEGLAQTVYAAGQQTLSPAPEDGARTIDDAGYAERIRFRDDLEIVEIDFGDLVFSNSQVVNDFYDVVEALIRRTGLRWYFLVNYGVCSVWPEAWVAFAHRGKRVNVAYSLGTARYDEAGGADKAGSGSFDPDMFPSRDAALARIEQMKSTPTE